MVSFEKCNSPGGPVDMHQLLHTVFKDKKWRNRLELHAVFDFWEKTVGSDIAAIAQPSLIRGNVLWVRVADSVWMQQLHLQKMLLLEKLNQRLPGAKLTDIHLQLDSSLKQPPKTLTRKPPKPALVPDKVKEQEFDNLIDSLKDEAIKGSLKSLWIKLQERRGQKTED